MRDEPALLTEQEAVDRLEVDTDQFRKLGVDPVGVYFPPYGKPVRLFSRRTVDATKPRITAPKPLSDNAARTTRHQPKEGK